MDRTLEIEYLELLPFEYKNEVENLLKNLTNAPNFDVKNELCQSFAEKFTTLPQIWEYWQSILYRSRDYDNLKWNYTDLESRFDKDFPQKEDEWPKIKKGRLYDYYKPLEEELKEAEFFISLPHSSLLCAFDKYEEKLTKLISNEVLQKYQNSCKLYQEIKSVEINDGKKFIEILKKTKNDEFVIKNIECQLSQNPWCQNLWIAYIEYLENDKNDNKALLSVLSRYCRFFISDKKMKEKYQEKIEEISSIFDGISEFWIDSIKFELHFEGKKSAINLLEKALKTDMKDLVQFFQNIKDVSDPHVIEKVENAKFAYCKENPFPFDYKSVMKNLVFKNPVEPDLPFGKLIKKYILENLDYQHLRKLYQTCKWFYFKYRFNLVHQLRYRNSTDEKLIDFIDDSLHLSDQLLNLSSLNNLWLTYSLKFNSFSSIKKVMAKVTKASLKILHCQRMTLLSNEYKLLTESKTLEKVFLDSISIKMENDENMPLEEVLKAIPNARHILITECHVTAKTPIKLSKLKFGNKIESLTLHFIMTKTKKFIKFLRQNLHPFASINLAIFADTSDNFYDVMEKKINEKWKPFNERPLLTWAN